MFATMLPFTATPRMPPRVDAARRLSRQQRIGAEVMRGREWLLGESPPTAVRHAMFALFATYTPCRTALPFQHSAGDAEEEEMTFARAAAQSVDASFMMRAAEAAYGVRGCASRQKRSDVDAAAERKMCPRIA